MTQGSVQRIRKTLTMSAGESAGDLSLVIGGEAHGFAVSTRKVLKGAHRSHETLIDAYRTVYPHGCQDGCLETLNASQAAIAEALLAEFRQASTETLHRFVVAVVSNPLPDDLPLAVASEPLDIAFPTAEEALTILVSEQNWAAMAGEEEAKTARLDLGQSLGWIVTNAEQYDLAPAATIAAYRRLARNLPAVADLIAMDTFGGSAANASAAAARVAADLGHGRTDALTRGLAMAVARWSAEQAIRSLGAGDVVRLRTEAGLSRLALAERIGIDRRHLGRLENGDTPVSADLSAAIVAACQQALANARKDA